MAVQNDDLLRRVSEIMDSKLSSFEQKISKQQRQQHEQQLAKLQAANDKTFVFKRKGNEAQYKFNNSVREKLIEANTSLSEGNPEMAFNSISSGIDLIHQRQKLIKLADSSKTGWRTVQEYTQHELASDEEDEKRIFKAEIRAEKKLKEERIQKARVNRRTTPYPERAPSTQNQPKPYEGGKKSGTCFKCGFAGHWAKDCNNGNKETSSKLSTCTYTSTLENITESFCNVKNCDTEKQSNESRFVALVDEDVTPVGRLKDHLTKWVKIDADKYILDVISSGYKIPFKSIPDRVCLNNNKSARDNVKTVCTEIQKLIDKGCVSEVSDIPFVVNPLTLAFNKVGKPRLVLDCRHINQFIHEFSFRMEDVKVAREIFQKGYFLFSFDLKSAYHHIEIFEHHRKYLGFQWQINGINKYFVFNVLPFGISSAAFIFTKLMRKVVQHWRSLGFHVIMYLDDGLSGHNNFSEASAISKSIRCDLHELGFITAESKSVWVPQQNIKWLGFEWDMTEGILKVTSERMDKMIQCIQDIQDKIVSGRTRFRVKFVASIVGQIISMEAAIGNAVRFNTRFLYQDILARTSWNSSIELSSQSLRELEFWKNNSRSINGQEIKSVSNEIKDLNIFSDASDSGFGTYLENSDNTEVMGLWTVEESSKSSTWRELEAINRSLNTIGESIRGKSITWHTDSKNVCRILEVGSKKSYLHEIAVKIFEKLQNFQTNFHIRWLSRESNIRADMLSKCFDSDDWGIKQNVFVHIDKTWGAHTCDRFASDYNAKCANFNSRWWCPNTSGVDAFKQFWGKDNNWLVPPPRLVCKTLNKLKHENGKGTLIIPQWKSAPFWPLLCKNDKWESCVKEVIKVNSLITEKGRGANGIFGGHNVFDMVALRIEF